jgi:hypothetical protein
MLAHPSARTLSWFLLRTMVPRLLVFCVGAGTVTIGSAMAVHPSAKVGTLPGEPAPIEMPSWTAADAVAYPGCGPASSWPRGVPARSVVVHSFRDDARRQVGFDLAWTLNHNDTEVDDLWVLGVCD